MKVRHTKRFLEMTGTEQVVFETRDCEFAKAQSRVTKEGIHDVYYCTTEPGTFCRPADYPGCPFAHVHASNVEPCDPEPSQGPEPQKAEAEPCVVEPADALTSRPALSETKQEDQ
jgi:hypothetical protein